MRITDLRLLLYLPLAIMLALHAVSCNKEAEEHSKQSFKKVRATVYADPSFVNLSTELAAVYETVNDSVDFEVLSLNEEDAIRKLTADSTSLILVSRLLTPEEEKKLGNHKKVAKPYIIAKDAVAFIINVADRDSIFTREQVLNMITDASSDKTIVFDENQSSSLSYINQLLHGKPFSNKAFAAKSREELIEFVSKNKNSIGVLGSNVYSNSHDSASSVILKKIKIAGIKTDKGTYYPFQADIASGNYPFSRNIYMLNSEHYYGMHTGFKNYAISPVGQRIVLKSGLLPVSIPGRLLNFTKKSHE